MFNSSFWSRSCNELGYDLKNLNCKNIALFTDQRIRKLKSFENVLRTLDKKHIKYNIFDQIRIEPTDTSFKHAIQFACQGQFDGYVAVGGGSVMDTCKAANLFASSPEKKQQIFLIMLIHRLVKVYLYDIH